MVLFESINYGWTIAQMIYNAFHYIAGDVYVQFLVRKKSHLLMFHMLSCIDIDEWTYINNRVERKIEKKIC